jgi:hypothetical protein
MNETFRADVTIAEIAEAYCLDCIDIARSSFETELDGSDASVELVEQMLGRLHEQLPAAKPSPEQIGAFAKMFGSYVGEVFRQKHGATWGIVRVGDEEAAGMQATHGGWCFWPWGRAHQRITAGPENNMWHYYVSLLERAGSS